MDPARDAAARDYCRARGLPDPALIRGAAGTSVYRAGDLVVRIAAPGRSAMGGDRQLAAVALLRESGVNAPASRAPLSHTGAGEEITVWEYVPHDPTAPYPAAAVGRQLRRLHGLDVETVAAALGGPPPALAAAAARGRGRVDLLEELGRAATGIPAGHLAAMFTHVAARFEQACAAEPGVVLHGDPNPGNVLWGVEDTPRLIDFEALTVGPWAWDLVDAQVAVARGLIPAATLQDLVAGYGREPAECAGWPALCWLRALNVVTWALVEARTGGAVSAADAAGLLRWFRDDFPGLPPTP